MYTAGLLRAVAEEISKYRLDFVGVQVRWDGRGTEPVSKYIHFSMERGMKIMNYVQVFSYIKESYQQ
jgi:hypothetical protein